MVIGCRHDRVEPVRDAAGVPWSVQVTDRVERIRRAQASSFAAAVPAVRVATWVTRCIVRFEVLVTAAVCVDQPEQLV